MKGTGVAKSNDERVQYMKIENDGTMGEKTCTKRYDRKMFSDINDRQRNKTFHGIWNMNWDEKRIYVKGLTQIQQPQSIFAEDSRRKQYSVKSDGQQFVVQNSYSKQHLKLERI